jgi:hypothetical protein
VLFGVLSLPPVTLQVELGTMSGGTSVYWGLAARARGGKFHTFDQCGLIVVLTFGVHSRFDNARLTPHDAARTIGRLLPNGLGWITWSSTLKIF